MSACSLSVVYNLPIRCDAEVCQCPDGMTHPEGKHFPDGRKYDEDDEDGRSCSVSAAGTRCFNF